MALPSHHGPFPPSAGTGALVTVQRFRVQRFKGWRTKIVDWLIKEKKLIELIRLMLIKGKKLTGLI